MNEAVYIGNDIRQYNQKMEKVTSFATMIRRTFINIFLNGVIMAVAVYFSYTIICFLIPPREFFLDQDMIKLDASEVILGKAKVINYKDVPTLVINTSSGLFAFSAVCTHLGGGCIVQWDNDRQEIVCLCNGVKYDLNGNVKSGPATKPLSVIRARMVDDKILIGEADYYYLGHNVQRHPSPISLHLKNISKVSTTSWPK